MLISLPQTAQHEVKTGVTKNSVTYAAATTINCKLEKKRATAFNLEAKELIQVTYTVYYTDTEIHIGDKIDGLQVKDVQELTDGLDGTVVYYRAIMAS